LNYRHAFHAGNFADCFKHAVLIRLFAAMQRKPGGVSVLDTHAGIGAYDLQGDEATRTGEWRAGIGRLLDRLAPELADYRARAGAEPGRYPGSPALLRAMLRPQDRLAVCELHPQDHALLRGAQRADVLLGAADIGQHQARPQERCQPRQELRQGGRGDGEHDQIAGREAPRDLLAAGRIYPRLVERLGGQRLVDRPGSERLGERLGRAVDSQDAQSRQGSLQGQRQ